MAGTRAKQQRLTPAMEQFLRAKEQYPDTILFFRMGDFYEMFFEDAVLASSVLDITLTARGSDLDGTKIPLAGVPHHAASGYIARLLAAGHRVAVAEQMEDPSKVKGVVPREVVRVVTPALVVDPDALDARVNNYLLCVDEHEGAFGLAVLEFSTSELRACTLGDRASVLAELVRLEPREILLGRGLAGLETEIQGLVTASVRRFVHEGDKSPVDPRYAAVVVDAAQTAGIGLVGLPAAVMALRYAHEALPGATLDIQRVLAYDPAQSLWLDEAAVRALEITRTMTGEKTGSLVHLLDETNTAMGARLLRRRVLAPLMDVAAIRRRHDAVEALRTDAPLRTRIRILLADVPDVERLAVRATLGVATPRDLGAIRAALLRAATLSQELAARHALAGDDALGAIPEPELCRELHALLSRALVSEPPLSAANGGVFAATFDARVDELRTLSSSAKDVILELEQRERKRSGIHSLKVRYTRVFGYYIEVTKTHLAAVPSDYRRKQTVAGAERFVTEELDALQVKILNADTKLQALETELFTDLRTEVARSSRVLRALATRVAQVDVSATFAELAHRHDYVRPLVDDSGVVDIKDSRHPIVERLVARGSFVPNDIQLDADNGRMMMITGPNMAGKSTAMRQLAISVLMAQAGSFVPASSARIGVADRIYTRVGASDNLSQGQSTFMLEMHEVANILRGATRKSLVIVDEVGRGTSTYDGLAIAWAVAEHLHDVVGCRSMFATHYHELCELAATRPGVQNFNVAAKEYRDTVVFLRKLVPGGANRSYGVAVAKLAGVPETVLQRARDLLRELESGSALPSGVHALMRPRDASGRAQLDLFGGAAAVSDPRHAVAIEILVDVDPNHLTPMQALEIIARLKAALENDA